MEAVPGTDLSRTSKYPFSRIQLGDVLGVGSTATVYKAQAFWKGMETEILAVKTVSITGDPRDRECLKRLLHEFKIYTKIDASRRQSENRYELGIPICHGLYRSHSKTPYALILTYKGESFPYETWRECGVTDADK